MQPTGKAKGRGESGIAVCEDTSKGIIADLFDKIARGVGDDAQGADLVVAEVVGVSLFGHGHGHTPVGVLEAHEQSVAAIINRQQTGQALPEVFFNNNAIDLLGYPSS